VIRYFRNLWQGAPPVSRILWFDMLAVGTLVNLAMLIVLFATIAAKAPTPVVLAVFLVHIPYNILLFAGVWRSAEREKADWAFLARAIASVWLIAFVAV
jgi:hypothetical protein